ncbi:MAG: dihydroorotase [Clostridiales Family XIII bacterium]|nr:dihydroorotase [Clostridiales Family XIII bacterium]
MAERGDDETYDVTIHNRVITSVVPSGDGSDPQSGGARWYRGDTESSRGVLCTPDTGAIAQGMDSSPPGADGKAARASSVREDSLVIDGGGLYLAPGFVDMHVHFRDPGFPEKEEIASGSRAASRGGYTTVCCMPNTSPAIDDAETVEYVDARGRAAGLVNVFAVGALTVGQRGAELADMAGMDAADTLCRELTRHGIAGVSEDGKSLMDEGLMRKALLLAKSLGLPLMDHAEDSALAGGCVNEGRVSEKLGVRGLPARAETNIIERDIRLASETGARVHLQHVSTAAGVALIRKAKAAGVSITAETAPHHFTLTEDLLLALPPGRRASAKMNPPLRTEADRLAIIEGLADGTIDAIATDHAPHEAEAKALPLEQAPFGIVGLETAFAASYTELVLRGPLTLPQLIDKMSTTPARLIGLGTLGTLGDGTILSHGTPGDDPVLSRQQSETLRLGRGEVREGAVADLALLELETPYRIDSASFASKGKNTPFDGCEVRSRVLMTIRGGKVTCDARGLV